MNQERVRSRTSIWWARSVNEYRPYLESGALRQMRGLPEQAFDMLVALLVRICEDPYDPVFSAPTAAGSDGSQGFPERALRMASSAVMPWAAAESR